MVGYYSYVGVADVSDVRITGASLMAVAGTLTGFVMTAMSMLVSASDKDFIKKLRMTGHFEELMKQLITSAAWWLVVIACGLASHLLVGDYSKYAVSFAVGIFAASMITFILAGKNFLMVVKYLGRS